jgi:hypothetical protein
LEILLFLIFVEDAECLYERHIGAPFYWVHTWLLEPTALKLRGFDLLVLGILLASSFGGGRKSPTVAPMRSATLLVLWTTIFWFVYGMSRGGDSRFASWQTYLIASTVLLTFTLASTCKTIADFARLGKWLIAAGLYRGMMCWISYFTWGRDTLGGSGSYLTTHDDTITWVVSILILIVHAVEKRSLKITLRNLLLILFFLGAIQFNSRRLAWVSLGMGLVITYLLFPPGAAKRRINRVMRFLFPLLALYVVVGWGRANPIFLPLRSMSSVSTHEDASTLARNAENLGLIATANMSSLLFGTGWGKPYIAISLKYDISAAFELWPYIPHNSILGLLAFTGALGFIGFWLAIPTSVFFNARVARLALDPRARTLGIIGAAQLIVVANQLYGDMGIFFNRPMYVIAVSYAMAMRLPRLTGVWGNANRKTPTKGG